MKITKNDQLMIVIVVSGATAVVSAATSLVKITKKLSTHVCYWSENFAVDNLQVLIVVSGATAVVSAATLLVKIIKFMFIIVLIWSFLVIFTKK